MNVFDNWPQLLKVHFLGGRGSAKIRDEKGNELLLTFDDKNVGKAFELARECFRRRDKYELRGDSITIRFAHHSESFGLPALLSNNAEFRAFLDLFFLSNFDADLRPLDEKHYMVKMKDLARIVRKAYQADIETGPCLPYLHEPHEYESWFVNALRRGGIFVDVGVYVGGYSVRACKLGAEVVSLEPDKKNFALLQRNLELNKCSKVHALNLAAGVKEEERPLYAPDDDGYGYSLMRKGVARGDVKVMPLDKAVLPFVGDSPVELTKIDVEGAELDVLNGATAILNRSNYLMIEIWPHNWNPVLNSLRRLRFKRVDIGRRWSGTNEVNVFFKRT